MNKRKLFISLIGVGLLLISFYIVSNMNRDVLPSNKAPVEIATAVRTLNISANEVARMVKITGRLVPQNSLDLYTEVGGVAQFGEKPFKEGIRFGKGELLIKINADEIESALAAGRSNFQSQLAGVIPDLKIDFPEAANDWTEYLEKVQINAALPELPSVDDRQVKLFLSGRNIYSSYYNLKEAETRRKKHILLAPFSGSVVDTQIDNGTLVRVGQPLGRYISTGLYELEAGISYRDVAAVKVGAEISLSDVNTRANYTARVVRINDVVDPLSQQVKIYAEVNSPEARSGLYLEGQLPAEKFESAAQIPVQALVDDRAIFVVKDSTAVLLPVEVLHKSAEMAIIGGFSGRLEVITSRHNEAFAGSKVAVTNIAAP